MQSVRVLGCRVDAIGRDEAVARIVALARADARALVVTLGTEMVVRARRDPAFRDLVNTCALSLCDTIGVLFAARLEGAKLTERVAGVELIDPLCDAFACDGIAIYLLGAKGDTAARAAAALAARHPGLRVAGARDGFFSASEDAIVADEIAATGARVIFVGLGSPRQERWIAGHLERARCAVGIGVGGSFDVIAGNVERAPDIWRRFNVEWLYRLLKEPQRWRRQLALPLFVLLALRERFFARPTLEDS